MFDTAVKMEEERDVLGGGVFDSNLYDFEIKLAYITKSKGGAMAVNLTLESKGNTLKQIIYISSGDAKGNKFTYIDKKTNEERPLPGYSQINSLCQLAIGKSLKEIDPEDKVIAVFDTDLKKEVNKTVPVLTELMGNDITIGILKVIEDKNKLNDATGKYEPTGETREINEMAKFFKTGSNLTSAEIASGETEGKFAAKWLDKNLDTVKNKAKGVPAGSGTTGLPQASTGAAPATTTNLFSKAT